MATRSLKWIEVNDAAGVQITLYEDDPDAVLPFTSIFILPHKLNAGDGWFGKAGMNITSGSVGYGDKVEGMIPKPVSGTYQPYSQASGGNTAIGNAADYYLKSDVLNDRFLVVIDAW